MPNFRARLWPPGTRVRALGWAAVIGLVAIALLAPATPALSNDTPGNNGTVKIHEGAGENDPGEVRNEPHVCTFHLHFYFSDPEQAGTWEIQEWSPGDKGTGVLSGTYDTQGDGEDRQPPEGVYTLDPGHYKLFWDGDLDTEKHDKMKVFWVECEETSTTTSSSETSTGSTTTGETTTGSTTTGATTTSSETTTTGSSSVSGTTTGETTTGSTTSGATTTTTSTSFSQTVSGTTTGETTTTSTGFSQTISGTTTSGGPTLPNTATASAAPSGNGGGPVSLFAAVTGFVLGSLLLLTPSRAKRRE